MSELTRKKYKKYFPKEKKEKALARAWSNRDFEISHYWKRAAYFWTFIAVDFAGYFALINSSNYSNENDKINQIELVLLCLGFIFSLAWLLANLGSKKWQQNWEKHITELENKETGPLYKTVLNKSSYSVSKINIRVNIIVLVIWILLGFSFINLNYNFGFTNVNYFTTITLTITLIISLDMVFGGGKSGFRYINEHDPYFKDYKTKNKMKEKIRVLASLKTDSMEGWGWISESLINENGYYEIENLNGNKTICYLRVIDANFIKNYEKGDTFKLKETDSILILNEYYRFKTGINNTNELTNIKITKCNWLKRNFVFELSHPNPYVRQNGKLTIISILLGLISIILTIYTLWK